MPAARGVKRAAASKIESKTKTEAGPSKNKKKNAPPAVVALAVPFPSQLGEVLTCGQGDVGQLGLGEDFLEKSRFTIVSALGNAIVDICAGGMHTVCIDKNGNVWTFGCNDEGALGRDTANAAANEWIPGQVKLPGKVVRASAGDSHTAVLLESGQVFAWGSFRDSHGNMGLTPKGNERTPIEMLPGYKVVQIASGGDHLAMLTDVGQIFTCGCAEQGQLGRVTARSCDRNSRLGLNPLLIPTPLNFRPKNKTDFDMLWAGTHCTFAREVTKGDIYVWGLNNYQQIGVRKGEPGTVFAPTISEAFAALKDKSWSKISGGPHHTLALDSEGTCYVIGRREYGRLGLGENCEDAVDLTPIPILQGKKCVQISCGTSASFAVIDNGDTYVWGMGSSGQLGTGSEDDENEPKLLRSKQVEGRFATNISAGGQHTVLLVKSLGDAKEVLPEPIVTSTAPQTKSDAEVVATDESTEEKIETDSANANEPLTTAEQADVEMTEKMEVEETPEEDSKKSSKPQKKTAVKRGRKGSASSTESSRSTKAAKNKQNGALATVKESETTENTESNATEETSENKTGGTQEEEVNALSQKSKRAESEEPEAKRMKIDNTESAESLEEKKEEPQTDDIATENKEEKSDQDNPLAVENKKEEEILSNGNGEAETGKAVEASNEDVEMKSVSEVVEKKCISSESQDEKTEGDVTRTEVKT